MATPVLNAEEFQYLDTGILMNGSVAIPFTDVEKVSGLDATDLRTTSHDREGMHGGYIDALYEGMRTVTLEGTLYASTTGFETYVDSLKANYAPSAVSQPFYVGTDAGVRVVYGKSLGFKYDKDSLRRTGKCDYQVQIVCEDPRIYDPDFITSEIFLNTTVITGRGYNKSYDFGYGAPSTGNNVTLQLGGNREQPGVIRIYGPITNPALTFYNTGAVMYFNLTIAAGEYLEINLNNRTVKLNGTAGRRNKLTMSGNWYLLQVGVNSFSITGSATLAGTTKLTVTANEAAWR
jgi:hypothetical protein